MNKNCLNEKQVYTRGRVELCIFIPWLRKNLLSVISEDLYIQTRSESPILLRRSAGEARS